MLTTFIINYLCLVRSLDLLNAKLPPERCWSQDSVRKSQLLKRKESQSGIKLTTVCLSAECLTIKANRLTTLWPVLVFKWWSLLTVFRSLSLSKAVTRKRAIHSYQHVWMFTPPSTQRCSRELKILDKKSQQYNPQRLKIQTLIRKVETSAHRAAKRI